MNNRRAFTLVEIIVVVGIIALLAALLLVGLKYVAASASTKSTRATLEAATALLNEYESARKLGVNEMLGAVRAPQGSIDDEGPARSSGLVSIAASFVAEAEDTAGGNRIIGQLPSTSVSQWAAMNAAAAPAWANAAPYIVGDRVTAAGEPWVCKEANTGRDPADAINHGRYWLSEDPQNPVLLDAWGNPLILVPGDGMVIWNDNGTPANFGDDFDVDKDPNTAGVQPMVIRATSRRPFFASAGPDGAFQGVGPDNESVIQGAQDNIYSFEN